MVADSSDQYSDQGMVGTTTVGGGTQKLQKKSFVGVGVRWSSSAGYVLRILPNAHKWQYFRDPKGAAGPKLEAAGSGKFIKLGSKPNVIAIRAFSLRRDFDQRDRIGQRPRRRLGHGRCVRSADGRQTVVTAGAKGSGAGTGITGVFDNVIVQVPNPF